MSSRRIARAAVALVTALVAAEAAAWLAVPVLTRRGFLYQPPVTTRAEYRAKRDPVLGWPGPASVDEFDEQGSRALPAFPDTRMPPCGAVFGDSFAYGEEVDDEHAWSNVLSRLAGCRVSNFGVPGYGTDQAYLRFRLRPNDGARVAILTHFSDDVLRNVNQYRNLIGYKPDMATLKPRFVLRPDGSLQHVPIPEPVDDRAFDTLLQQPSRVLTHEWFVPGGPSGIRQPHVPYAWDVLRSLGSYKVRALLSGQPTHAAFYDERHPSQALLISAAIARAFAGEATRRGMAPLIVVLPGSTDFASRRASGQWVYAPLVDRLQSADVPVLDAGEAFEQAQPGGNPCALFTRCGGHLNDRGNDLIAHLIFRHLRSTGRL